MCYNGINTFGHIKLQWFWSNKNSGIKTMLTLPTLKALPFLENLARVIYINISH